MLQGTKKLFSRFCIFTFLWGLKMCVLWTDLWGPFKSPHYDGLFSYYNVFMRTFLWGLENVPTIWTDPTLLVCIHMNVPIGVQRCTHTHTHTPLTHYRSSLRNLARLFIWISRANLDYIQPADALLHHRPGAMLQKGSLFQSTRFLSPLILNNPITLIVKSVIYCLSTF